MVQTSYLSGLISLSYHVRKTLSPNLHSLCLTQVDAKELLSKDGSEPDARAMFEMSFRFVIHLQVKK